MRVVKVVGANRDKVSYKLPTKSSVVSKIVVYCALHAWEYSNLHAHGYQSQVGRKATADYMQKNGVQYSVHKMVKMSRKRIAVFTKNIKLHKKCRNLKYFSLRKASTNYCANCCGIICARLLPMRTKRLASDTVVFHYPGNIFSASQFFFLF